MLDFSDGLSGWRDYCSNAPGSLIYDVHRYARIEPQVLQVEVVVRIEVTGGEGRPLELDHPAGPSVDGAGERDRDGAQGAARALLDVGHLPLATPRTSRRGAPAARAASALTRVEPRRSRATRRTASDCTARARECP